MHHIQRKILNQLMHASTLGYAKMRPPGIESNHFAYHLEQLLYEGLVQKQERQYSLTPKGLALVDRVSHETMSVRTQPHIVTSLYITNKAGQILLYQHKFQPYLNLYGPPQGRLHYEENIAGAASRELVEKTGLANVSLRHRGIVYIHATKEGKEISKLVAHIFTGKVSDNPELAKPTSNGSSHWLDPNKLSAKECMPGFLQVRRILAEAPKELFFTEIEAEL